MPKEESASLMEEGGTAKVIFTDFLPVTESFIQGLPKTPDTDILRQFETVYFFGRIAYTTDGQPHKFEFCAYLIDLGAVIQKTARMYSIQGVLPTGRYILRQCPKWHGGD
jgi:hypothetical protein